VNRSIVLFAFLLSFQLIGQEKIELKGDFGYSISWYFNLELHLLENNIFELKTSSDISGSTSTGVWELKGDILKLKPVKMTINYRSRNGWTDKIDSVENFRYHQLKVLSEDQLFLELEDQHIHINRLPSNNDGPFKIFFPSNSIELSESPDSLLLKQIGDYINLWDFKHDFEIELIPNSSAKDRYFDDYVGLKRCRSIITHFVNDIGAGSNWFNIKDDLSVQHFQGESYVTIRIIHKY
jgi:hypothetical protein